MFQFDVIRDEFKHSRVNHRRRVRRLIALAFVTLCVFAGSASAGVIHEYGNIHEYGPIRDY